MKVKVSFKRSILNKILKKTLSGNYQTCIITCIYPDDGDEPEEIWKTINLAKMAGKITKSLVVNGYFHNEIVDLLKDNIYNLEREISNLRIKTCEYNNNNNKEQFQVYANSNKSTR